MNSNALLAACIAVLPLATPFLAALYKYLIGRLPASRRALISSTIASAVAAAEQVYQNVPASGQAKRQFVISRVRAILGRGVNPSLVEVLLEEAVAALPPSPSQPPHSAI